MVVAVALPGLFIVWVVSLEIGQDILCLNITTTRIQMAQFTTRTGRAIAAATLFGAFLSSVPLQASRAQQADQPMQTTTAHHGGKHMADRAETRIKELHDKLHITAAQEEAWANVAQTMRDTAKTFQASTMDRSARLKTMSAVDDLKSYQIIADQHADGLKQLIPVFETLYDGMSPDQKKNADQVFGEHQRHEHMNHM